jgi:hypothetical protein
MALDFTLKDVFHNITVKFSTAFLSDAKKPYNLKAVNQGGTERRVPDPNGGCRCGAYV